MQPGAQIGHHTRRWVSGFWDLRAHTARSCTPMLPLAGALELRDVVQAA